MSSVLKPNTLEYSYDESDHLDDDEALDAYKREKALDPDALIILDDLHCGHWEVKKYKTDNEKSALFYQKALEILERLAKSIKR